MLRILKFLITGDWHLHKWQCVATYNWREKNYGNYLNYEIQILECEHCGKRKKFKVKG